MIVGDTANSRGKESELGMAQLGLFIHGQEDREAAEKKAVDVVCKSQSKIEAPGG